MHPWRLESSIGVYGCFFDYRRGDKARGVNKEQANAIKNIMPAGIFQSSDDEHVLAVAEARGTEDRELATINYSEDWVTVLSEAVHASRVICSKIANSSSRRFLRRVTPR